MFSAPAQTGITVSGTVTDDSGAPVPGAVIALVGSPGTGTISGADGKYSLRISVREGVLKVSCLGYAEKEARIGTAGVYDFVLSEDAEMLERVVVVGYGTMKESDITGAVTHVRVDENTVDRTSSVDKMLKGRAAGVRVVGNSAAPGAGFNIKIRGNSSFNGGGEPLYVVDGVILNSASGSEPTILSKAGGNYEEETNGLMGIDPQDIATMEILKDASATAIYGALGANGVVLITTKSARRDKPVIRFSAGVEAAHAIRKIDMLDLAGFADYMKASGIYSYDKYIYSSPGVVNMDDAIDWQDYVCRTAFNKRTSLSVANRTKTTNYMFSVGFNDIQGVVQKSGMSQFKIRLNLDQKIGRKLTVGMKINLSRNNSNLLQGASSAGLTSNTSFIRAVINGRPFKKFSESVEEDASDFTEDYGAGADRWLKDYQDNRKELRVIPNIYAEYKIAPWISFRSSAGADYRTRKTSKWRGPYVTTSSEWALAAIGITQSLNFNFDNMLSFDKNFGDHNISGTLGTTYIRHDYLYEITDGWNVNQYIAQIASLNAAPNARFAYSESSSATFSALARAIYSYKGRYVLTATFRRDGSSRFSKKNRYASFPSFALAWRLNEEPWFDVRAVSMLKLRAGWGRVGNQAVSAYQTLSNYTTANYPDHTPGNENHIIKAITPSNLANTDLKWETTEQWNAGIDLKLNRNRLSFILDVYDKNTFDLLQAVTVPATTGFSSMWVNLGTINNRGIEFSFDATLLKKNGLNWNVFGNISHNENKIVSIGLPSVEGKAPYFLGSSIGSSNYCKTPVNIFMEGQPMGLFYGLETDGIVQEGETGPGLTAGTVMAPGGIKYIDHNGNGYVDSGEEDKVVIGDPNPDFTFGFGSSLNWRNFTLDLQFEGSYGNDIANINLLQEEDLSRTTMNIRREAFEGSWSPANPDGKYPKIGCYEATETRYFTDRQVEDGSYLRLADLSLSYSIPKKKIKGAVKGIEFSLAATNVFLITRYRGFDPDVSSYGNNIMKMGVDYGSYPSARTYSAGVKMTF